VLVITLRSVGSGVRKRGKVRVSGLICEQSHGPGFLSPLTEHLCTDGIFEKSREELEWQILERLV